MAVNDIEIEGLDKVVAKLEQVAHILQREVTQWKVKTAVRIKASAVVGAPRERGNLAGSAYIDIKIRPTTQGQEPPKENDSIAMVNAHTDVYVGFTASYALAVHENLEMKLAGLPRPSGLGTYWNPGGPRFLVNALRMHERRARAEAQAILARRV